ncbi:MAG: hypothetical protein RL701_7616 [Pseudomonadota bacterium]|jgi:hypothetical protein
MAQPSRLLKISTEPSPLPDTTRVSEMLREFAQPLLYVNAGGPADLEEIRTAMMLAMMCWNLPVYEALGNPLYERGVKTLAAIREQVPRVLANALKKLVEERKTKFADVSFLVLVEVTGTQLSDAAIVAEARLPPRGQH